MSVQQMILQNNRESLLITNRMLGIVGMILSPMLYFTTFFHASEFDQPSPYPFMTSLGGILYLLGAAATATAMRNLRATGSGRGAGVLYIVQMIGLFLAMGFDVFQYAAPHLRGTSTLFFITDMAYPFSHVLMIVVGVAVVRAGVWRGWRQIPALLVGLALPLFFAASALVGRAGGSFLFPLFVTVGFFLLGYAVVTTETGAEAKYE
ncbi:MAG TPA: hypothetical protein VF599_01465 [Pyrinomonadaceae bacterium]|jgi:hypothetical protein